MVAAPISFRCNLMIGGVPDCPTVTRDMGLCRIAARLVKSRSTEPFDGSRHRGIQINRNEPWAKCLPHCQFSTSLLSLSISKQGYPPSTSRLLRLSREIRKTKQLKMIPPPSLQPPLWPLLLTPLLTHAATSPHLHLHHQRKTPQCYYPSGDPSDDVPCDPTAEVSMCCANANACLSNGLCRTSGTDATHGISFARGTCTDSSWMSLVCPWRCRVSKFAPLLVVWVFPHPPLTSARLGRSERVGVRFRHWRRAGVGVRRQPGVRGARGVLLRVGGRGHAVLPDGACHVLAAGGYHRERADGPDAGRGPGSDVGREGDGFG